MAGFPDEHSFEFLTAMPRHSFTALIGCLENAVGGF